MPSLDMTIPSLSYLAGLVVSAAGKGALLMLAAAVAAWLLRSRAAAIRHAIWSAAIVGQLALLLLIPAVPRLDVAMPLPTVSWSSHAPPGDEIRSGPPAMPPAIDFTGALAAAGSTASGTGGSDVVAPVVRGAVPLEAEAPLPGAGIPTAVVNGESSGGLTPGQLIALLWVLGAAVLFARFAAATAAVARVARRSRPVQEGAWLALAQRIAHRLSIRRPLRLLRGAELQVPVTWGVVYPVVLLPDDADEWPEERRRFVLLHELAHVRRFDALTQLLAQVATAIFWFNPLVWYASYRIRVEREHACDDYVLEHGTSASTYADGLLDIVKRLGARRDAAAPAFATLAMARRGELEGRMLAILDPRVERRVSSRLVAGFAGALFVLSLPLAALRPVEASPPAQSPETVGVVEAADRQVPDAPAAGDTVGDAQSDSAAAPEHAADSAPATVASTETRTVDDGLAADVPNDSAGAASPAPQAGPPTVADTARVGRWSEIYGGLARYRCTPEKVSTTGETVLRRDSDGAFSELFVNSRGYCSHFAFIGAVRFTESLDDVASMAPHARAYFHELTVGGERLVSLEADASGVVTRSYMLNGRAAPVADARGWLGEAIRQSVLRHGYGLAARVEQLMQRRGLDAALQEAGASQSNSARRVYYNAILDHKPAIDRRGVDRVLRQAATTLTSDSDLRVVASKGIERGASAEAVQAVITRMRSDSDRRVVLSRALAASDDDAALRLLLRSAREVGSSSDKAYVLRQSAPRAMRTAEGRRAFFATAATLQSSSDMRSALAEAAKHLPKQSAAVRELLAASPAISSNSDRASLLRQVASAGLLVDEPARQAFNTAAATLTSDSDYRSVMRALR